MTEITAPDDDAKFHMQAALKLAAESPDEYLFDVVEQINSAILTALRANDQRNAVIEECAMVAEQTTAYDDALQKSAGCMTVGQRIAAAIRARKDKP